MQFVMLEAIGEIRQKRGWQHVSWQNLSANLLYIATIKYVWMKEVGTVPPEIDCNDIFLKVIFLSTVHNCKPKMSKNLYIIGLVTEI